MGRQLTKQPTITSNTRYPSDLRTSDAIDLVVPTAVRVEAGWDRTAPTAALINLLRIGDAVLGTPSSDTAAALVSRHGVSIADAHIGAVVASRPETEAVTILTSDLKDMRTVSGTRTVTVVRL